MSPVSVAYFPQCHMSNLRNASVALSILGVNGHSFSGAESGAYKDFTF